ncbi:MAG: YpiB family protein [Firmicutes bacterium]|nr:YpiB family protein [Bacillota bacterium]
MQGRVDTSTKKRFIKWFMEHFELQNAQAAWLLSYISSQDRLIRKTHFVDETVSDGITLIISAAGTRTPAFQYSREEHVTTDVRKALYDLYHHPDEPIYLVLHFAGKEASPHYNAVVEGTSALTQSGADGPIQQLAVDLLMEFVEQRSHRQMLLDAIDRSLEAGDRETFLQLSEAFREQEARGWR